ncbi:hypothetical protein GCM10023114_52590 [Mycolicibacterium sediminis]|uniref:Uncharacterized protein n=2 Tax=Mycolicibacterium sediminis TaxID=1286180 RepID=A0A7I7QLW2_9MYCO|nr:hypothetical protein MSEDJ_10830 [Mycolicibacterium sediminis]
MGYTLAFAVTTASALSPLEVIGVSASLLAFWAPATCWSWWGFAPGVLVVGVLVAILTHRHPLPDRGPRWRRVGTICSIVVLVYGGWTLIVGILILVGSITSAT